MKRRLWILASCSALTASGGCAREPQTVELAPNVEFSVRFLANAKASPRGNLVVCPHGLSHVIDLVAIGATGATLQEIDKVRGEGLRASRPFLAVDWNSKTRAWVKAGVTVRESYASDASRLQCSITSGLDSVEMRRWAASELERPIDSVIDWSVSPTTGLVIVNVSRFVGTWQNPFITGFTKEELFHCASGEDASVAMMHARERCGYFATEDWQVACLEYTEPDLCALICVPRAGGAPGELLARTGTSVIASALEAAVQEVDVAVPRFDFTGNLEAQPTLIAMGMKRAWSQEDAEFGGISDTHMWLSSIQQAVSVRVDEVGTRAEAVTRVEMVGLGYAENDPPPVVRADHPFVFLVVHRKARTILFAALVGDPRETTLAAQSN